MSLGWEYFKGFDNTSNSIIFPRNPPAVVERGHLVENRKREYMQKTTPDIHFSCLIIADQHEADLEL